MSKQKHHKNDSWIELVVLIEAFINSCENLSPADKIILIKMIKTLKVQQGNMSSKVMRATQNNFEKIKEKYTKQK